MVDYFKLNKTELLSCRDELIKKFKEIQKENIHLDISRGKPDKEQLELSLGLLDTINSESNLTSEDGVDCRNYGDLSGIIEARRLFSDLLDVDVENIVVCGNSSVNILFDTISRAYTHGFLGSKPWSSLDKISFLCPVPGYDKHFAISEYFNMNMINIAMKDDGPDMDEIERLVSTDASIKGIWCVPKYSNPTGVCYSDEVIRRFASLKPKAEDFRIFWDNAYLMHHLGEDVNILNIIDEAGRCGNEDMVIEVFSTSKICFPGGGISCVAASKNNIKEILSEMKVRTLGGDKLNQLRQSRYLLNKEKTKAHMNMQAKILSKKFDIIIEYLDELKSMGLADYIRPKGGYFLSFNTMKGCAKAIVAKCEEAGLILTPAGATFPYGKDENDENIRIAPSYATIEELKKALEIFIISVKIISIEKIIEKEGK